jgi:hypothetical protein
MATETDERSRTNYPMDDEGDNSSLDYSDNIDREDSWHHSSKEYNISYLPVASLRSQGGAVVKGKLFRTTRKAISDFPTSNPIKHISLEPVTVGYSKLMSAIVDDAAYFSYYNSQQATDPATRRVEGLVVRRLG